MPAAADETLLGVILDSWDRNNRILINLLRALPPGGLEARATSGSLSVAEMFTHVHFVRLIFISEDAPDLASPVPSREWVQESDAESIASDLESSAKAVRETVTSRIRVGREMNIHYDHPLLFLEHMIWHEGYHHGQIKLALKIAGLPLEDDTVAPLTWHLWFDKTRRA